jgi:hypothetical protein
VQHRKSHPLMAVLIVATLATFAISGCGSTLAKGRTTLSKSQATQDQGSVRPLVDMSTKFRIQAAVGDSNNVMLLTQSSGDANDIASVSLIDAHGSARVGPKLPPLEQAQLLPWSDGYAITGARCASRSAEGSSRDCTQWDPTVVFVNSQGLVLDIVVGPTQHGADFLHTVPANDKVLFAVDAHHWYEVSRNIGFAPFPLPPGRVEACRLRDDTYIGAREELEERNPNSADDSAGALQFLHLLNGTWTPLGNPAAFPNSSAPSVVCVAGGFVTNVGILNAAAGVEQIIGMPNSASIARNAVGIDVSGRVYFAPGEPGASAAVVGAALTGVKIGPEVRWIAINSAGTLMAFGGESSSNIVSTK